MNINYPLNPYTNVHGDVSETLDGFLEVTNIQIEMLPEHGGLSMWAAPVDNFTKDVMADELRAVWREEMNIQRRVV